MPYRDIMRRRRTQKEWRDRRRQLMMSERSIPQQELSPDKTDRPVSEIKVGMLTKEHQAGLHSRIKHLQRVEAGDIACPLCQREIEELMLQTFGNSQIDELRRQQTQKACDEATKRFAQSFCTVCHNSPCTCFRRQPHFTNSTTSHH